MINESILLISPDAERFKKLLQDIHRVNPSITISPASTGLDGLMLYRKIRPYLTIVSDKLTDIPGASIATIIKDNIFCDKESNVWLIDVERIRYNLKADQFFPTDLDMGFFKRTIQELLNIRILNRIENDNLRASRMAQKDQLPDSLENDLFEIYSVYSPFSFSGLSGDGLYYHYDESKQILYGFLFDCTGHNLMAFYNTSAIYHNIYGSVKYHLRTSSDISLSEVFTQVNRMIFEILATEEKITAAIVFTIDFKNQKMKYCSAGIPYLLIQKKSSIVPDTIRMRNPLLGVDEEAEYMESEINISDLKRIYISSDGLSSLLLSGTKSPESIEKAKKDDVSIIIIDLKDKE